MVAKVKGKKNSGPGAQGSNGTSGGRGRGGAGGGRGQGNKKKKECDKKLSEKQKKDLRRKSPSRANRRAVNREKDAQGRRRCPTCGQCSPPGFKASTGKKYRNLGADHIVPFDTIIKKKGFACLKKAQQLKVLNNKNNFVGICPPCNSSRQTTKWNEWNGRPAGITDAGKKFAKQTAARAPGLSKALGAQINRLGS